VIPRYRSAGKFDKKVLRAPNANGK
jgi:hypothetical protein